MDIRGIPHHRLQDEITSRVQNLNPEIELDRLIPKLAELQSLTLEARRTGGYLIQDSRLASLYLHVSYRLRRVQCRATGEVYQRLYEFAKDLYTLHGLLSRLFPDVEFKRFPLPAEEIA